jgi:hypothetical protein
MTTSQLIFLQNTSSAVMEVKLACDHPKDVSFELGFDQKSITASGVLPQAGSAGSGKSALSRYQQFLSARGRARIPQKTA